MIDMFAKVPADAAYRDESPGNCEAISVLPRFERSAASAADTDDGRKGLVNVDRLATAMHQAAASGPHSGQPLTIPSSTV